MQRETIYMNTFQEINEHGKQEPNCVEMTGINKRRKRVDDGSIVITETDKSSELAIVSM